MDNVAIVFPHQLFQYSPIMEVTKNIILVEEWLFFKQYLFHKQKISFHRASMKFYESYLRNLGMDIEYIESNDERSDIRNLLTYLKKRGISKINYIEVTDNWLNRRINSTAKNLGLELQELPSPLFISSHLETKKLILNRKILRQTDFYIVQRKLRNILIAEDGKPVGGKWTFDTENRKRYPNGKVPPQIPKIKPNDYVIEAISYTTKNFSSNVGYLDMDFIYPVTYTDTINWFERFLKERFEEFGIYQDAILQNEHFLHHSVISPMLNVGLITPNQVIKITLDYAENNAIPLNSTEGFIRQVLGWREFIRGIYEIYGSRQRTKNFWGFTRKIPKSFWKGETGILPVDITIKKVLKTGYCHHIERLMVLSNFMLLCEFQPDEVYRWFMEMFVDAYDWVMVPNVYGMGQFADGGLMSSKPYISSSKYLKKMGDYDSGEWEEIWDSLFWRFINVHREFFAKNPRTRMLVSSFDKMNSEKKRKLLNRAEVFLKNIDETFELN